MENRIVELLVLVKSASQGPNVHRFLPYIVKSLEVMLDSFSDGDPDPEILIREARGLGRLVTDDYSFSESTLGQKLLGLVSDIVSTYKVLRRTPRD